MKSYLAGVAVGLLGAAILTPAVTAQGRGGSFFTPPARSGTFFNAPATNGFQQMPGRAHFRGRFARGPRRHLVYPYAAYSPYFYYPDYDYDNGYNDGAPEEAPPAPRAAAPAQTPEIHKAADAVVMELRGDHWVRLTTTGPVEVAAQAPPSTRPAVLPAFDQAPAAAPLPPAILAFRDGHHEEATRYTIVGEAIFLKGDYYATGSWTRKIPITDLDIPATLKLNSERGTKFTLPSRPGEIILRP